MPTATGPLLVFGPRSPTYDFGPGHPLTPRRFGPGIDLLRAVGAEPGLAPEPAPDEDLLLAHTARYLEVVRRFSRDPFGEPAAGIGPLGDDPPFAGMHEAAAAVAGGSLRATEAILRGDVEHAFHPGGGLHHAMPERASGFCIYDDPALAIALARRAGLRVLYVDLDVHHGDGVQEIHAADPGVMTISFHESGRYLFPGSGFANEVGKGIAAGTVVNVPLEPFTGEDAWLAAVRSVVPALAAAFGPDIVVSQHGADSHAWDPLAHLQVTTTAMGRAARLVDEVAHRFAGGRWLATGGGGYDVYRVVPRAWALTWLAGAHREPPTETPADWRERWASEAASYGQWPAPTTFDDEPNAGLPGDLRQESAAVESRATAGVVRRVVVPRLLQEAEDREWWTPLGLERQAPGPRAGAPALSTGPTVIERVTAETIGGLTVAERVAAPRDPLHGRVLVERAVADRASVSAAVAEATIVALAISVPRGETSDRGHELIALGVAPEWRRRGLARRLLDAHLATLTGWVDATVTLAERDVVVPLPLELRSRIAHRLLAQAGFEARDGDSDIGRIDRSAFSARRPAK
jgi:acetoin utilization protein AcuC